MYNSRAICKLHRLFAAHAFYVCPQPARIRHLSPKLCPAAAAADYWPKQPQCPRPQRWLKVWENFWLAAPSVTAPAALCDWPVRVTPSRHTHCRRQHLGRDNAPDDGCHELAVSHRHRRVCPILHCCRHSSRRDQQLRRHIHRDVLRRRSWHVRVAFVYALPDLRRHHNDLLSSLEWVVTLQCCPAFLHTHADAIMLSRALPPLVVGLAQRFTHAAQLGAA